MFIKFFSSLAAVIAAQTLVNVAYAVPAIKIDSSTGTCVSSRHHSITRTASAQAGAYERNLENIRAYRRALKQHTREREPLEWARIQNDLGVALAVNGIAVAGVLGERQKGIARLKESVAAFRQALKVRTRERMPNEWAESQHGLAISLKVLGELREIVARSKK